MENEEKQKKKINLLAKLLKTKVIFILIMIVIAIGVGWILKEKFSKKEATADFSYLSRLLEKSSELTTAKFKITGVAEYKDEGVKIINRSDFMMVYSATVRAGVELKEVEIEQSTINPNKIVITMPKAKVFDCHVDQNEIKYFDEKFALFNVDSKKDANKACALAEQDGIKEAETTGILEFAETEAEYVIKDILTPALPEGYTLVVKKAE